MKTKKVNFTTIEKKSTSEEREVADRDYYIPKFIEKEMENKKTVVVEIYGGCLDDVHNLPEGYNYALIDWDNLKEMSEEEFKELIKNNGLEE